LDTTLPDINKYGVHAMISRQGPKLGDAFFKHVADGNHHFAIPNTAINFTSIVFPMSRILHLKKVEGKPGVVYYP
jgi:hypothetical protein